MSARFAALDLLRGIAALAVLVWHFPFSGTQLHLGRGYLAVDLFFVLSGFVIAHAYEDRLGTPRQFRRFCLARLIRLYPLYFAATVMATILWLLIVIFGRSHTIPPVVIVRTLAPAILFLPVPPAWAFNGCFFPMVRTAWSLAWELVVNLAYGVFGARFRAPALALLVALGAIGIGVTLAVYGSLDRGWGWKEGPWCGGARALFSFFAGVAVFRLRKRRRAPRVAGVLLAATLLLSFYPDGFGSIAYDAICVTVLFPLLVWLGAEANAGHRMSSTALFLGYLSYPIYLLQEPIGLILGVIIARTRNLWPGDGPLQFVLYLSATILGSWAIARLIDSPVRGWLSRSYLRAAPRPAAQSAP